MAKVNQAAPISRRQRAERTRTRILDAAYDLFCSHGYEATTMQQVADAAEVAVQTVYLNFRTKPGLLTEVEGRVVLGDQPAERWREQPWARAIQEERDPRRLLELFVKADTEVKGRIGPFVAAVGAAMPNDTASVERRERGRDQFFNSVIDRLAGMGALREGLTPARALDIIRVINTPDAFNDLTMRRGWSRDDWSAWLIGLLTRELLASQGRRAR